LSNIITPHQLKYNTEDKTHYIITLPEYKNLVLMRGLDLNTRKHFSIFDTQTRVDKGDDRVAALPPAPPALPFRVHPTTGDPTIFPTSKQKSVPSRNDFSIESNDGISDG
jgi:hypothetical protein